MAGEAANEGGGRTDHDSKCIHLKTFYQKRVMSYFSQRIVAVGTTGRQVEGWNPFVRGAKKCRHRKVSLVCQR